MKVKIWVQAASKGSYLYKGDYFEQSLFLELEDNKDEFKALNDLIENESITSKNHKQDVLMQRIIEDITIPFEFAKQLSFGDIIKANCFYSETEIGKKIIELLDYIELSFILVYKKWNDLETLKLEFEACDSDFEYDLLYNIINGKLFEQVE